MDSVTKTQVAPFAMTPSIVVRDYALTTEITPLLASIEKDVGCTSRKKYLVCSPIATYYTDWYVMVFLYELMFYT